MNSSTKALLKFFNATVSTLEITHMMSTMMGEQKERSIVHKLHIKVRDELSKDEPDMNKVSVFINMIEYMSKVKES